jgi:hypothetical protein
VNLVEGCQSETRQVDESGLLARLQLLPADLLPAFVVHHRPGHSDASVIPVVVHIPKCEYFRDAVARAELQLDGPSERRRRRPGARTHTLLAGAHDFAKYTHLLDGERGRNPLLALTLSKTQQRIVVNHPVFHRDAERAVQCGAGVVDSAGGSGGS